MRTLLAITLTATITGCASLCCLGPSHTVPVTSTSTGAEPVRVIAVVVWGEVRAPKKYSLAAGARLTDAIAAAGGFTEHATGHHVRLRRADGKLYQYDTRRAKKGGTGEPLLRDGDIVLVPDDAPML